MVRVTIMEKAYGPYEKAAIYSLKQVLTQLRGNLKVKFKVTGLTERHWINLDISGEDSFVFTNLLDREFGLAPISISNISLASTFRGKIIDSGKVGYGLYIDIGVSEPSLLDALFPLHKMRSQLVLGRPFSARQIIDLYSLYDYLPLTVKIVSIDTFTNKIEVELSERQVNIFKTWANSKLDRVIAVGATERRLKDAIIQTKHQRDVVQIENLGLLEHAIVCKLGTEAPGLISELGPKLLKTRFYAIRPEKIGHFLQID
ncbi:DUF2110 family protein [Candidatus Bathyarchaeota archaeon]|nr:DUF2110 family protein [Candidatus Bathyarchaeota archaeon]